jgi:hypothetical protein
MRALIRAIVLLGLAATPAAAMPDPNYSRSPDGHTATMSLFNRSAIGDAGYRRHGQLPAALPHRLPGRHGEAGEGDLSQVALPDRALPIAAASRACLATSVQGRLAGSYAAAPRLGFGSRSVPPQIPPAVLFATASPLQNWDARDFSDARVLISLQRVGDFYTSSKCFGSNHDTLLQQYSCHRRIPRDISSDGARELLRHWA